MSSVLGDVVEIGTFGLIDGDDITGENQASAARQASQAEINFSRESRDLARKDLQPFRNFGAQGIDVLNTLLTPEGQYEYVADHPLFQASVDHTSDQLKNIAAANGNLNSGGTVDQLFKNYLATSQQFIQPQINNLFNRVNMGQSAAAGQANTALSTGANMASSAGAGIVGAANARTNAFNQLLNLGGQAGSAFIGGGDF